MIGPNGAGKSSLLRAVAGLVPAAGRDPCGRSVLVRARGPRAGRRDGVPGPAAVPAPDRSRERRLRPSQRGRLALRGASDRSGMARPVRRRRSRASQAAPAVRRAGPARLHRPSSRERPAGPAAGRAVLGPRRRGRRGTAGRARPPPRVVRRGHAAGHPRRHRRAHPRRRRLGARGRRARAGRPAARGRRASADRPCRPAGRAERAHGGWPRSGRSARARSRSRPRSRPARLGTAGRGR